MGLGHFENRESIGIDIADGLDLEVDDLAPAPELELATADLVLALSVFDTRLEHSEAGGLEIAIWLQ